MARQVYVGGAHSTKYHLDPQCQHLPGYDRHLVSEEAAQAHGYEPCAACAKPKVTQVVCIAAHCIFNVKGKCNWPDNVWAGRNPQIIAIGGCTRFERKEYDDGPEET